MNKEDPYRDQAEKLRQKIERPNFEEGQAVKREELPPRSRVHQKGKKNKWKIKYPVIRLLVLFFILLPITIFSVYSAIEKNKIGNEKKTMSESSEEFETIDIESPDNKITNPEEDSQTEDNSEASETTNQPEIPSQIDPKEGASISSSSSNSASVQDVVYHTVQPGETIFRIAIKYYNSKAGIDTIKSANNLTSNEIRVGQVLTIPLNK